MGGSTQVAAGWKLQRTTSYMACMLLGLQTFHPAGPATVEAGKLGPLWTKFTNPAFPDTPMIFLSSLPSVCRNSALVCETSGSAAAAAPPGERLALRSGAAPSRLGLALPPAAHQQAGPCLAALHSLLWRPCAQLAMRAGQGQSTARSPRTCRLLLLRLLPLAALLLLSH